MSSEIKKQRIRTGLTQEEAAKKIGIHPTTLNKYESGARIPSGKVLVSMSKLFEVPIDSLAKDAGEHILPVTTHGKEEAMYQKKYEALLEKYCALQEKNATDIDKMLAMVMANEISLKKAKALKKKLA